MKSWARSFPPSVRGRRYEGFPDERWLDIRRYRSFAKPLERRFALCARKGFDAVEPDNLAGFENRTGFPLSAADQLRFNRWVARRVHARGMAVALKNDPGQAEEMGRRARERASRLPTSSWTGRGSKRLVRADARARVGKKNTNINNHR